MNTRRPSRRAGARAGIAGAALTLLVSTAGVLPSAHAAARHRQPQPHAGPGRALANLHHLDWLGDQVSPPQQPNHTTFRLQQRPDIGVLWVYANRQPDGSYQRVGGGSYDAATDTYGQGAYDADDIARAAVVYLRDWRSTGSTDARHHAFQLLRGLTYLQDASGPDAGNVVLWMQPDGTLNPSADPKDNPDPSDSDASFWLARTIWALGEGYAAFQHRAPAFAAFLHRRLDLAIAALDREVLDKYGTWLHVDGQPKPAWLIGDGADASSEAALGLAAYTAAGGPPAARRALRELASGISALSDGSADSWPFGALLPTATSLAMWHAWGAQMPAAVAAASGVLHRPRLLTSALRDSFTFDPWLLTSGGPDNGRLPTRVDPTQIAYGADARLESLFATASAGTRDQRHAALQLAGMVGAWFFGANPAGTAMYHPATGVTFDGVNADGTVNQNSGAESTIHGLLAMLALQAHPRVARWARTAHITGRLGTVAVQAESGQPSGDARAVTPTSLWTGESQYGGSGYESLGDHGRVTLQVAAARPSLLLPVLDLRHGDTATVSFRADDHLVGRVDAGAIGPQGDSPAPGALLPRTLPGPVQGRQLQLTATAAAENGDRARLDAILVEPLVSHLVLAGHGHGTALLSSRATHPRRVTIRVPGTGPARITCYDGQGRLRDRRVARAGVVRVVVPAGGFAVVRR